MPYYNTCSRCGATLDPGEKCTCEAEEIEAKEQAKINRMVDLTKRLLKNSKDTRRRRK